MPRVDSIVYLKIIISSIGRKGLYTCSGIELKVTSTHTTNRYLNLVLIPIIDY